MVSCLSATRVTLSSSAPTPLTNSTVCRMSRPSETARLRKKSWQASIIGEVTSANEGDKTMIPMKTFKFKEGTVIASVSEEEEFDMQAGTIESTGRFTACLSGGTAPGIKPRAVKDAKGKEERIFRSADAAFEAAFKLAVKLGYHPIGKQKQ